jgi:outer membrane receptor protein involved in Fe transport
VNSGLRVKYSRLGAMVRARLVDERNDNMGIMLPMFITVDAAANFNMYKGLGLQIWARNLTDEVYQESLGIPGWPRSFFVTLSYAQ